MIQSILFFILGFLCAGFLALMVAPAIWRRAVALTRKRIEASVPLSLTEIQADKDRMRAEFAMSTRRLEMSIKAFKEKAAAQIIEINRNREELKRLATEPRRQEPVAVRAGSQGGRIARRAAPARGPVAAADRQARPRPRSAIEQRALGAREAGPASMTRPASPPAAGRSSSWRARPRSRSLPATWRLLRGQRKEAERRMQEIAAENKAAREALKAEQQEGRRPRKEARAHARHADRPRGEARPRASASWRGCASSCKANSGTEDELNRSSIDAQAEKIKLEASWPT